MWERAQSCKAAFGGKKTIAVLGTQWKAAYDLQAEMKLNSQEMVGLKRCSKEHGLQYEQMLLLREGGMQVVVDHQLEFLPPSSFLLVATVRGFGRLLPKEKS